MLPALLAGAKALLGNAWNVSSAFQLADQFVESVKGNLPSFTHACTVNVVGGPNADVRRCWFLACSIAFGRMRRSPGLRGGSASMKGVWDITGKSAQIELVYNASKLLQNESLTSLPGAVEGLPAWLRVGGGIVAGMIIPGIGVAPAPAVAIPGGAGPGGALAPDDSMLALIQQGPDQITVGGAWPPFLVRFDQANVPIADPPSLLVLPAGPVVNPYRIVELTRVTEGGAGAGSLFREWPTAAAGRPTFLPYQLTQHISSVNPGMAGTPVARATTPGLPDDGRVITTGEKNRVQVQSPRPHIDGATRCSLVSLVSAALETPCFLPPLAPVNGQPIYSTGHRVYAPGGGMTYGRLSNMINATKGTVPAAFDGGTDGLPPIPPTTTDYRG